MIFRHCFLMFVLAMSCATAHAAGGGSFGGGDTAGGGVMGGWDAPEQKPAVKCGNHAVGYNEDKKCSEYTGTSAFIREHTANCRRTCKDSNGTATWVWAVVSCADGYHLASGKCEQDKTKPAAPVVVTPPKPAPTVTNVTVHGTVLIPDDNGKNYEGAIGATVQMRDKVSVGMATDTDGRFKFNVDKGSDVLRIAYVGYKEEFIPASQCTNGCTIKLVQDSVILNTVEAIGCAGNIKSHLDKLSTGCTAGNAELASTIQSLQNHCNNTKQLSDFDAVYAKVKDIDPTKCMVVQQPVTTPQPVISISPVQVVSQEQLIANSRRKITAAVARLEDVRAQLGQSVWKNADGGFNTSRLVSDSVAGVVLGTAGGLITSNLVKKNQVKNGFEDIHCTVGGQVVADYGDTLTIGIN